MDQQIIIEGIGYVGMVLVVISMIMTSMIKLRFFNAAGCLFSIVYSYIISSYPVLALNTILFVVNSIQIYRHYTRKRDYDFVASEVAGFTIKHFLEKYKKNIVQHSPTFFHHYPDSNYAKVIFCDNTVIGMIVGRREGDFLHAYMDYIDDNYVRKDLIMYIHDKLRKEGIKSELITGIPENNIKYYLKAGWKQDKKGVVRYLEDKNK